MGAVYITALTVHAGFCSFFLLCHMNLTWFKIQVKSVKVGYDDLSFLQRDPGTNVQVQSIPKSHFAATTWLETVNAQGLGRTSIYNMETTNQNHLVSESSLSDYFTEGMKIICMVSLCRQIAALTKHLQSADLQGMEKTEDST